MLNFLWSLQLASLGSKAPITLVDNKDQSLRTQSVVQGDCYHGVGVTCQLTNNPLKVCETAEVRENNNWKKANKIFYVK